MRNLSNLLAVFALVAMMGLLVGCGCSTTKTPAQEDMVNTGEETVPPAGNAGEENLPNGNINNTVNTDHGTEPIVDEHGNLIDENAAGNGVSGNTADHNATNNTGNVVDDAGNMVGDVVEDAGNAVEDVGRGVKNMTNDVTR